MRLGSTPPESPPAPLLARAGSLLGSATLAGLLGSIPAAVRIAHAGGAPLRAWIALAACALVPTIALVAFARSAREGARTIAGEAAPLVSWGIATWAMTTFLALAAFGALLRATTHHHGLAGVTFALGGLAIGAALALVTRRLMQMARGAEPWGRAALVTGVLGALVCATLLVVVRVARAAGGAELLSATLTDALAFVVAAAALSRQTFARVTWLALGGPPLAIGLLALGWALLSRDPALIEAIRLSAPLFARIAAFAGAR
jgi:choline-sulfatase